MNGKGLGRRVPTDWDHVQKYPVRSLAVRGVEIPKTPVVLGINWYSNFNRPEKIGTTYWIGRGSLGSIDGGHAICTKPYQVDDPLSWWDFYDQGSEGSCVGFSCSRMMSLLNRERYASRWLYGEAQLVDEWTDTPPESGSSVRAGCDVLRTQGHRRVYGATTYPVKVSNGISANRWATTWDEVRAALRLPDSYDGVPLLNSWGRYWPHIVRITDEAGARVLGEYGEACLVTDR